MFTNSDSSTVCDNLLAQASQEHPTKGQNIELTAIIKQSVDLAQPCPRQPKSQQTFPTKAIQLFNSKPKHRVSSTTLDGGNPSSSFPETFLRKHENEEFSKK